MTNPTGEPLVSVILCGYNQGEYLAEAIESVLGQTYPRVELIVVDNGSSDDSPEVARRYGHLSNVRLLLHPQNGFITVRMNEAIRRSSGQFISFLFADDWYLPDKTRLQVEGFRTLPPDYGVVYAPYYRRNIYTGVQWIDPTPRWSGWVLEPILRDWHRVALNMEAPLTRRACFVQFPFHEDVFQEGEMVFRRIALRYRFQPLDVPVMVMRDHAQNLGKAYELMTTMNLVLLDRLQHEPGFPRAYDTLADRVRATMDRNLGWQFIRLANDPIKGRRYLWASLEMGRGGILHPRFLLGLALSSLPLRTLRWVNRAVDRIRRHRENVAMVSDAGPAEVSPVPNR